MKILRERYSSITDTALTSKNVDSIFENYCEEFLFFDKKDEFVAMFLNIIRDFLSQKIGEHTLSTLIHKSLFDERTKKYHYEPFLWSINDILSLVHELLDITWIMESTDYKSYLETIKLRHSELVKKYQDLV